MVDNNHACLRCVDKYKIKGLRDQSHDQKQIEVSNDKQKLRSNDQTENKGSAMAR